MMARFNLIIHVYLQLYPLKGFFKRYFGFLNTTEEVFMIFVSRDVFFAGVILLTFVACFLQYLLFFLHAWLPLLPVSVNSPHCLWLSLFFTVYTSYLIAASFAVWHFFLSRTWILIISLPFIQILCCFFLFCIWFICVWWLCIIFLVFFCFFSSNLFNFLSCFFWFWPLSFSSFSLSVFALPFPMAVCVCCGSQCPWCALCTLLPLTALPPSCVNMLVIWAVLPYAENQVGVWKGKEPSWACTGLDL